MVGQRGGRLAGHFDLDVDAIQQWPGYPRAVTRDLFWRTMATTGRVARVTTWTGIHRRNQLEASLKVLPAIKEVWVYDVFRASAEKVTAELKSDNYSIRVAESAEQACAGADVIVTATSSFQAIVMNEWIKPGTHINAIGTDMITYYTDGFIGELDHDGLRQLQRHLLHDLQITPETIGAIVLAWRSHAAKQKL